MQNKENELHISPEPNWILFEKVAFTLENELDGVWLEKVDGLDQRYWDLKMDGEIITLHMENYLGISAFSNSKDLLLRVKKIIELI